MARNDKEPSTLAATLRDMLPVMLTLPVLSAAMLAVYAALSRLTAKVWLGAALGTALALVNFIAMILCLLRAEKAESPERGQLFVRGNYIARLVVLAVALFFLLKSGRFDVVATLLPFVFLRLALFVPGFIKKR